MGGRAGEASPGTCLAQPIRSSSCRFSSSQSERRPLSLDDPSRVAARGAGSICSKREMRACPKRRTMTSHLRQEVRG